VSDGLISVLKMTCYFTFDSKRRPVLMWVSHMRTLQVSAARIMMRIVCVTLGINTHHQYRHCHNVHHHHHRYRYHHHVLSFVISIHSPSSTRLSTGAI
jgi:hypothetical protein